MEKSITASNEKVSLHIPDDLAFSILSKLPLKSLKRFGGIHKSWVLLFENPHFMSMYRNNFLSKNHSYYDDTSLLLHQNITPNLDHPFYDFKMALYMLSGERFENHVNIGWPNPFQDDYPGFKILGCSSINGILCLYRYFIHNKKVVLWNPATEEFKIIPSSPVESASYLDELHGFGYDHLKHDYKVIRKITFDKQINHHFDERGEYISYDTMWEIYSLRNNSWSKLNIDMPSCYGEYVGVRVYMDGVCHWWGKSERPNYQAYLVSFNLSDEMFVTTAIPSDMDDNSGHVLPRRHLVVLNGSIAVISNYLETTTFHISILGELGVNDSWTKLFIIGPLPYVKHPIGTGKKGNLFFRKKNNELVWYDISTQKIEELGVKAQRNFGQIVVYKESLRRIGEINS